MPTPITASRASTTMPGCAPTTGRRCFGIPSTLDPAIRAHLEAENAYQAALMADTAALQKTAVRRR